MRLTEVFQMDEEKIIAVLRNGQKFPIYKNPTMDEIKKIGMNGIVKGILTKINFIGFDFNNVSIHDLPPINGYPIIIYMAANNTITVELFHNIKISKDQFEQLVFDNNFLKNFTINKVIWHNETE